MLPISTIICPIDFSEHSYDALTIAAELAAHFSATVILVHVITPLPSFSAAGLSETGGVPQFDIAAYLKEVEVSAQSSLKMLLAELIPENVPARSAILHGQAADAIVEYAAVEKASMIVISTHGRTGFRRFVSGSVAEKVVRLAACPVLTIHARQDKTG